jgi:hypothetical protein
MQKKSGRLSEISMVTANFGEGAVLFDVMEDWFKFLGGKPGEVVVVDCGSDAETQSACWKMLQAGMIDKLQLIHTSNDDYGKDKGHIKEYTAGEIASKPYVLHIKTDTLPYRQGQDGWLEEALDYLDREDIFAISGAWNLPSMHHHAWSGWYFSQKCSLNFALMKRSMFMASAHEFGHEFILSGFKGKNPASGMGKEEFGEDAVLDRYFIEVAFEEYIKRHNVYVLSKVEDPNWTIFHTNVHNELLKQVREDYLARKDIEPFMNLGFSNKEPNPAEARYYGLPVPQVNFLKKLRIAFGASPWGPSWRNLKRQLPKPSKS